MRISRPVLMTALSLLIAASSYPAVGEPASAATGTSSFPTVKSIVDDFNGPRDTRPKTDLWVAETGGGGWGNSELQTYTNSTRNASLDGAGHLRISAIRETRTGNDGITRDYTSARLNSRVSVRYGTIAARIMLPSGTGLWPAFWTLGSDIGKVGWPRCGEIDIMEALNDMRTVYGTVHGPDGKQDWTAFGLGGTASAPTFAKAWHVFAVRWAPDTITWLIDGKAFRTINRSDMAPGSTWAANKPHHLLLNVAVGGWPGDPDRTTFANGPQTMLVDWVRAQPQL